MNSRFGVFATAALVTFLAGTASAQQGVKLQFNAGQVTLSAQNAPVRAILQEWARLGGATIVNGDRVTGPPVTLELTAVPERQALDIVLRSVAGYIVAPRPAGSQGGVSAFDRIVILPTSSAPRAPVPAATAAGRQPVIRPGIIRPPDQVDPGVENGDPLEDPGALIQGRDPRVVQPPFVGRPPVGADVDTDIVMEEGQKEDPTAPAGVAPTPGNPFGVPAGSSTTPGVISPPVPNVRTPQPQQRPNTNRVQ